MAQATLLSYFQKAPCSISETISLSSRTETLPPGPASSGRRETRIKQRQPLVNESLAQDQVGPANPSIKPSTVKAHDSYQPPGQFEPTQPPSSLPAPPQTRPSKPPSPSFQITRIHPSHIPALTSLTTTILPVRYTPKFYTESHSLPHCSDFSYTVLHSSHHEDKPIGWIACRAEPLPTSPQHQQIYIRALAILAPYRSLGLATRLLAAVLDPELLSRYKVTSVYAHVWERNEDALEWYEKRGFRREEGGWKVEGYYTRLKPSGAWILRRDVCVQDYLGRNAGPLGSEP